MANPLFGFNDLTFERIAKLLGKELNTIHAASARGRLDIKSQDSLILFTLHAGSPKLRKRIVELLTIRQNEGLAKQFTPDLSGKNELERMALEAAWSGPKTIRARMLRGVENPADVSFLAVTKEMRRRQAKSKQSRQNSEDQVDH